ncbi:hypothetical protein AYJ10_11130 [Serratia marcescens]|nr:hypothetical protein AYJ10_11130 [Serratia marcescens]
MNKKTFMDLNIFLAQKEFSNEKFDFFISKMCKAYDINGVEDLDGKIFVKESKEKYPKWKGFIEKYRGGNIEEIVSRSSSAVIIIRNEGRVFALTFGYGRSLIEHSYFEPDFGIKTALNMLKHDFLRSVDTFSIDDAPVQKRTQASSNIEISMFGLDVTKDILRSVTGTPLKGVPFKKISGGDSAICVGLELEPDEIKIYTKELLSRYKNNLYKKNFSWVDNLRRIKDLKKTSTLDEILIKEIKSGNVEDINILIPEIIDPADIESFSFTRSKHKRSYEIVKEDYIKNLPIQGITIENIKKDKLFVFNHQQIETNYSVYKCINFEYKKEKSKYILFLGNWFEVDSLFVESIDRDLEKIPLSNIALPNIAMIKNDDGKIIKTETEGDYNIRASEENGYLLLDRKLVKSRKTTTSIELCDLADLDNKILIHAKQKKGGSSGLSHLFAQGNVSAELILSDDEFRKGARKVLQKEFGKKEMALIPEKGIKSSDYEIVFLIMGSKRECVKEKLPFFSKVNLANTYSNLIQKGFKVSITGVD